MEVYAIMLKPTTPTEKPKFIGSVGVPRNEPLGAELGYGLSPGYRGLGYMSEALALFLDLYWNRGSMFANSQPY